jgi:hypothetical protein
MISKLFHHLRIAATGLTLAVGVHGGAQAGLITGDWDPQFGSTLPGLNWTVHAELLVPNACSTQGDGTFTTSSGNCAGTVVQGVFLRMYNDGYTANDWGDLSTYSSDPPYAATWAICDSSVSANPYYMARCNGNFSTPYSATDIRVASGNVVGLNSGAAPTTFITSVVTMMGTESWPSTANFNQFQLYFTATGPVLTCLACNDGDDTVADTTDLTQFLITYNSNDTSEPKFTDEQGNALGAVLDGEGTYLRQATGVPEPGALALVLAALTAVGWSRRRRA